jgi:hypothetical protein
MLDWKGLLLEKTSLLSLFVSYEETGTLFT